MVFNLDRNAILKRKSEMSMRREVEQTVVHDRVWLPSENLMYQAVSSVN